MRPVHVIVCLIAALSIVTTLAAVQAEARAGGGRSMGSRGSRSYSRPASPAAPAQQRQNGPAFQQQSPLGAQSPGGGFLRSMAGGIMGGMLGGMLFRSLGFGGMGGGLGGMGGGIGIFDILLIGGILYLIYRMIKKRRESQPVIAGNSYAWQQTPEAAPVEQYQPPPTDAGAGISYIRQMDPSFSEERFSDQAMDYFFKIQGAWTGRDLSTVSSLLTDEMSRNFRTEFDQMKQSGRINRLENIAVRTVDIVEAWQEQGSDFVTARIYANLLDYTTDESGQLLEGSKTEPVKFEEFWTFTRPVGPNAWKLSGIDQK